MKPLFSLFLIFLFSCGTEISPEESAKVSDADTSPKTLYVAATAGLRVRDAAGLDGQQIGSLPFATPVTVLEVLPEEITISEATGRWTRVEAMLESEALEGWVFGGFLWTYDPTPPTEEEMKADTPIMGLESYENERLLVGSWREEGYGRGIGAMSLSLRDNNDAGFGFDESDMGGTGTWLKTGLDTIVIDAYYSSPDGDVSHVPITLKVLEVNEDILRVSMPPSPQLFSSVEQEKTFYRRNQP